MNKVLIENIIYFWVINYCYKSKKLECQEEILKNNNNNNNNNKRQ